MASYKFPPKFNNVYRVVIHKSNDNIRIMPRDKDNQDVFLHPEMKEAIDSHLENIGILEYIMFRGVFYYLDGNPRFCADRWDEELQDFVPFSKDWEEAK